MRRWHQCFLAPYASARKGPDGCVLPERTDYPPLVVETRWLETRTAISRPGFMVDAWSCNYWDSPNYQTVWAYWLETQSEYRGLGTRHSWKSSLDAKRAKSTEQFRSEHISADSQQYIFFPQASYLRGVCTIDQVTEKSPVPQKGLSTWHHFRFEYQSTPEDCSGVHPRRERQTRIAGQFRHLLY